MLPTTDGFFVEVVGESHYQDALRDIRAELEDEDEDQTGIILSPEPENPHDPKAVAVTTYQGVTIGYLSSEEAARYQPTLLELRQRGLTSICGAKLPGGPGQEAQHRGMVERGRAGSCRGEIRH